MLQRQHHQDHAARLVRIWEGLPNCSIVIFRHIQKTAGTSVRSLFENLQRDWQWSVHAYWNPCWKGQAPGVAIERMRLVRSMRERLAAGEKSLAPPMAPVASGPPHTSSGTDRSSRISLSWLMLSALARRTHMIRIGHGSG